MLAPPPLVTAKRTCSVWTASQPIGRRAISAEVRMDWSETVRKAAILAQEKGYITFYELDQILPRTVQSPKEIESLLTVLNEEGIRVEE
jgi:hypothetical protein